jgi:hypothetical protein
MLLLAHVRQEGHKSRSLNGLRYGVLTVRGATCLSAADDPPVPVHELAKKLNVLVINVQRAGTHAIDVNRVLFLRASADFSLLFDSWRHAILPETLWW